MAGIDVFEPLTKDYGPAPTRDRDRPRSAAVSFPDLGGVESWLLNKSDVSR